MAATDGLRERKKQQTRARIAQTGARLFARRGYENVSVRDVARAAEVAEQTVYNYFPTKQHLLLDRDDELQARLVAAIRDRPAGISPAEAIRGEAVALIGELRSMSKIQVQGGLGYLAARSPAVRRLSLEMTDRHAEAIAGALGDGPDGALPAQAKLHGVALAWVFQTITDETGRRALGGQRPAEIADALEPLVGTILDDLDGWLSA
jgi:AcrR family transcriptional regulator